MTLDYSSLVKIFPNKLKDFHMIQAKFAPQRKFCFSDALGLGVNSYLNESDPTIRLCSIGEKSNGSRKYCFRYVVPKKVCMSMKSQFINAADEKKFPLSGMLAVFDEVSTVAIINEDKQSRAGASTNLSTALTPYGMKSLPKPGDELDFNVNIIKIGRTFGFAEAEVCCSETGNIIAVAKHSKFLENGSLVQTLAMGKFLPLVSRLVKFASSLSLLSLFDDNDDSNKSQRDRDRGMDEILSLQSSQPDSNEMKMTITHEHQNPVKQCHGGAIAMAMEKFANEKVLSDSNDGAYDSIGLQSMVINYISTGKKSLIFESRGALQFKNSHMGIVEMDVKRGDGSELIAANGVLHFAAAPTNSKAKL